MFFDLKEMLAPAIPVPIRLVPVTALKRCVLGISLGFEIDVGIEAFDGVLDEALERRVPSPLN